MKKIFTKEVIISSIIFFILGCAYNNWQIFRIGTEYEMITITTDRYINYGNEYLIDDFIKTKEHYLNINDLIDYIIEDSENICITEDKYIKINDLYYNVCKDGIRIIPSHVTIIDNQ